MCVYVCVRVWRCWWSSSWLRVVIIMVCSWNFWVGILFGVVHQIVIFTKRAYEYYLLCHLMLDTIIFIIHFIFPPLFTQTQAWVENPSGRGSRRHAQCRQINVSQCSVKSTSKGVCVCVCTCEYSFEHKITYMHAWGACLMQAGTVLSALSRARPNVKSTYKCVCVCACESIYVPGVHAQCIQNQRFSVQCHKHI